MYWSALLGSFHIILWSCALTQSWTPTVDLQSRQIIKNLYQLADLAEIQIHRQATDDDLLKQIDEIEERVQADCQQTEQVFTTDISQAQEQLDQYKHDLSQIQDQLTVGNQKYGSIQDQIQDLTQQNDKLTVTKQQAKSDLDAFKSQLQNADNQYDQLNKKLTYLISANTNGTSLVNDLINFVKKPNTDPDLDQPWNQIVLLLSSSTSDDVQARLGKIQAEIDKYRGQTPKQRLDTKLRIVNLARQLISDLQKDLTNLQSQQKTTTDNYTQQRQNLVQNIQSQRDLLKSLTGQISNLSDQIEKLQTDLVDLEHDLDQLDTDIEGLEQEISELENGITELVSKSQDEEALCQQYEDQLNSIRQYLKTHPATAIHESCQPGDPHCPLCLYDEHCPEGLQCSKFAICYNATLRRHEGLNF